MSDVFWTGLFTFLAAAVAGGFGVWGGLTVEKKRRAAAVETQRHERSERRRDERKSAYANYYSTLCALGNTAARIRKEELGAENLHALAHEVQERRFVAWVLAEPDLQNLIDRCLDQHATVADSSYNRDVTDDDFGHKYLVAILNRKELADAMSIELRDAD